MAPLSLCIRYKYNIDIGQWEKNGTLRVTIPNECVALSLKGAVSLVPLIFRSAVGVATSRSGLICNSLTHSLTE